MKYMYPKGECMKKYKYLLFDNDGTLMNFKKCEEHAFETAYKNSGAHSIIPYSDEILNLYSEVNDSWWKKLERKECTREELMKGRFKEFLTKLNISTVDPEILSEEYPKALSEGSFLYDGAETLLNKLSKEYDIYIITNGIGFVQKKRINKCAYLPYIKGIFISEELGAVKPEKEYFDYVVNNIPEKNRENILIVGDSQSSDILGGINSGIDTCWYNPKGDTPKYNSRFVINSLNELKKLLI